jgi:hypothetical protein
MRIFGPVYGGAPLICRVGHTFAAPQSLRKLKLRKAVKEYCPLCICMTNSWLFEVAAVDGVPQIPYSFSEAKPFQCRQ